MPSAPAKTGGDLRTRILSALILGPVVLLAVFLGGWVFHFLIAVLALLGTAEWVRLVEPERARVATYATLPAVAGVLVTALAAGLLWAIGAGLILAIVVFFVARGIGSRQAGLVAFAVPYLGLTCTALVWLRDRPDLGLGLFLYLMLVVWATDIGAYAAGRTIGGPKLAPRISPKKTWAGLIGGMASAAILGLGVAFLFDAGRPMLAAVLGAVLAVVGQAGDLFESAVKRRFNVKDSGNLIPGHGGVLDRVDGLVAAAPVFALFHAAWGTSSTWW